MSRWRPPAEKKSPYITPEGFAVLQREQRELWSRRAEVTAALSAAAAEGDRSENAEYIYRKKELREIDRRIRYLQKRIPDLKVVEPQGASRKQVFFGAWVTLEDEAGKEFVYRLVGSDELEPGKGWISIDSPLARALLKKSVDEDVSLQTPAGAVTYTILEVGYRDPEAANPG